MCSVSGSSYTAARVYIVPQEFHPVTDLYTFVLIIRALQIASPSAGMKAALDNEETGPNRNSADFRIKKAQVCTHSRFILLE